MKIQPIQRFGRSKNASPRPMRIVHELRVERDLDDEDRQRALRRDVVAEGEAADHDLVELGGPQPAEQVRHEEPDREEDGGELDVVLPVTLALFGRQIGHAFVPCQGMCDGDRFASRRCRVRAAVLCRTT
jgi:hypothetical protein